MAQRDYHLPGEHDQLDHGNWADGAVADSSKVKDDLVAKADALWAKHKALNDEWRSLLGQKDSPRAKEISKEIKAVNDELGEIGEQLDKIINEELALEAKEREETVDRVARTLGVPSGTDTTFGGDGYKFKVGGEEYVAAGQFNPATNTITIYNGAFQDEALAAGVVAHELQHAKFNQWRNQATKEHRQLIRMEGSEQVKYWVDNGFQRSLTPEGEKKFPFYASWKKFRDDDLQRELERADGITPYSASYWREYNSGSGTFERAVDETLAEVAKLRVNNSNAMREAKAVWTDLYDEINKLTY